MSVAVVTGSSGELGRSISTRLLELGHEVVGLDQRDGGTATHFYACDLRDTDAITNAFAQIALVHGPVLILVNNAGVVLGKDFLDTTPADFDLTMGVNLRAAFFCAQLAARQIVGAGVGGRIIHIASAVAHTGSRSADYAASKAALLALTRSMAKSLARYGILTNAVAPGVIDTAMNRALDAQMQAGFLAATPLGRTAAPREIANVVAFLCGPESTYMNGAIVDVNGGMV